MLSFSHLEFKTWVPDNHSLPSSAFHHVQDLYAQILYEEIGLHILFFNSCNQWETVPFLQRLYTSGADTLSKDSNLVAKRSSMVPFCLAFTYKVQVFQTLWLFLAMKFITYYQSCTVCNTWINYTDCIIVVTSCMVFGVEAKLQVGLATPHLLPKLQSWEVAQEVHERRPELVQCRSQWDHYFQWHLSWLSTQKVG